MLKKITLLLSFLISGYIWPETLEVPVITYHTHAPFILENRKGLTYELHEYLTEQSQGRYHFTVIPMTRARVDKMLEEKETAIVPWVSPVWFQDEEENHFMWTGDALMKDGNLVISRIETRLEYKGGDSVMNMNFGGVRGHHYETIDDLVAQHKITRYDADRHIDNLNKLIRGRIDFTVIPMQGALDLIRKNDMEDKLYISSEFHSSYERKIIISHEDRDLKDFLDRIILKMKDDPLWQNILSVYQN